MVIKSLQIDADGYPSDAVLDRIKALDGIDEGAIRAAQSFMLHDFERLAGELPYANCWSEPSPDWEDQRFIHFATGGWSGCEDFIDAVLSIRAIEMLYHYAWKRGGLWTFEVPTQPASEAA